MKDLGKKHAFSVNYVGFSCVKTFHINVSVKFFLISNTFSNNRLLVSPAFMVKQI